MTNLRAIALKSSGAVVCGQQQTTVTFALSRQINNQTAASIVVSYHMAMLRFNESDS